jgi:serine/threonine-protein kinase
MILQPSDRIDHYTIVQKLGHGGMSEVYLANDAVQQRAVVLKFPHEDMAGDPATYEGLRREIQIGKLLTHPNIQKLYDLAGDPRDPYLVFEYVDGITLREVLREERRLPIEWGGRAGRAARPGAGICAYAPRVSPRPEA